MNEPILIELNGKTYVRWNARVYTTDGSTHPYGVREPVQDKCDIDALEKRYGAIQRQQGNPRPPFVAHDGHYSAPTVRSKGQVTPREKRANGRAE